MATIFLVEDNPADVQLFRMALQHAGLECDLVLFEDGAEIIDCIRQADGKLSPSRPGLIILDLNLPKNDGLEILQILRDAPAFANVPVAVLSSSSSARERSQLSGFRICEFIAKPPDLEEYLDIGNTIRRLLETYSYRSETNGSTRVALTDGT